MNYRVQKDDTLWDLSRKYGIPLQKLLAQVPEAVRRDPRKLMPGMELDLGLPPSSPSVLERPPSSTHPAMETPEEKAIRLGAPLARGLRPGDVTDRQRQAQYAQTRAGMGAALAGPPVGAAAGGIGGALAGRGLTDLWNRGKEAWNSEGPAQQPQNVRGPDLSRVYKPQPDPGRFENMSPLLPGQRNAAEQFRGMQQGGQMGRTHPDRVAGWIGSSSGTNASAREIDRALKANPNMTLGQLEQWLLRNQRQAQPTGPIRNRPYSDDLGPNPNSQAAIAERLREAQAYNKNMAEEDSILRRLWNGQ